MDRIKKTAQELEKIIRVAAMGSAVGAPNLKDVHFEVHKEKSDAGYSDRWHGRPHRCRRSPQTNRRHARQSVRITGVVVTAMPERPITVRHEHRLSELRTRWDREQRAFADPTATVGLFNAHMVGRKTALFWPTVDTALLSKHPWVRIACDSCDTITEMDLRMKPRDPDASIRVVLRDVRCARCNGHGRPRVIGLARFHG
jgi:hypothetical protein